MQQIWTEGSVRHKGKSYRGITQIVEHCGEHFAWTLPENGKPATLVYIGDGYEQPRLLDQPGDRPAFMAIQCGSLKDPYGDAILSRLWFLWYRLRRMTEFYEIGARDALQGRPVFQERGGTGGGVNAPVMSGGDTGVERARKLDQLRAEIAASLVMFRETGVLVIGNNLEFKEFADPSKAAGWEQSLQMWRQACTVAIEGSTLTATVSKEGGSRALGTNHKDTKLEKCSAAAEAVAPQVSRQCLDQLVYLNFPGEIDPEDMSDVVFSVSAAIDPERLKAFVDIFQPLSKAPVVDPEAIAEEWNIPIAEGVTAASMERPAPPRIPSALRLPGRRRPLKGRTPPPREARQGTSPPCRP